MDFKDIVLQWLRKIFGNTITTVIFVVAVVFGFIWWNSTYIMTLPGVQGFIEWVSPIPPSDAQTVTVLVANFADDEDEKYEKLILSALMEIKGIKTRQINQTISTDADDQSVIEVMKESGAEIMLWGSVLRGRESDTLQLHWSPEGNGDGERTGRYTILENNKHYPDKKFGEDLANVLHLVMLGQYSKIRELDGSYTADKLLPFIEKARKLLEEKGWGYETRVSLLYILGDSLTMYGEQRGDSKSLEDGIALYRQILALTPQNKQPIAWAVTQRALCNALRSLGEREGDAALLEEAVAACREALKEYKKERAPLDWAATQNNLGNALGRLGESQRDTARLEEAVAAFREVLKEERIRELAPPRKWALTQMNLCNTLRSLGEREGDTALLEEAAASCREALKENTKERAPLYWAMTQNNLGTALAILGARQKDTARLEEAAAAFREALKERTRESVPLAWAMTQNNLGSALQIIGERQSDTALLEEAVVVYREVLKEHKRESVPLYWAATQNNLAGALWAIGKLNGSLEILCNALGKYLLAWDVYGQAGVTSGVSLTSKNIQTALTYLSGKTCTLQSEEVEIIKRYQSTQK